MPKFKTRKAEGRPTGRVPHRGSIEAELGDGGRQLLNTPRPKKPPTKHCQVCGEDRETDEPFCPVCLVPLV